MRITDHQVVCLPGPAEELEWIRRVVSLDRTMPASRVDAKRTGQGNPSPDSRHAIFSRDHSATLGHPWNVDAASTQALCMNGQLAVEF